MTPAEEVKSKLAVEQVIGDYIPLKQAGYHFKSLCPFHQEKTPSFVVSPDKQIWHCFGCNEGGDIFTFVQKYEGVDFREALQTLAQKAGVSLKGFSVQDQSKKKLLFQINEDAVEYFQSQLKAVIDAAKKTRDYLVQRGISEQSIASWGLGLSTDSWDSLCTYLQKKSHAVPDMVAAGLVIERENKKFDRFRRRLMFPIRDAQGRVIGFTGRTLNGVAYADEEHGGKYVNSPQTAIYNKSQILYGFDKARGEIRRLDYAIIVEGNTDVILSHQAGIANVVAVSGTALTPDQLLLLRRYSENIVLAFDSDSAGSQAVFRGITAAWDLDMNVKVIVLRGGKDPAEVIQQDAESWKQAIRKSVGVVDFYFEEILARVDLSRSDHKKKAAAKIMEIIRRLKAPVEKAHYVQLLARRLDIPESALGSLRFESAATPATAVETPKKEVKTQWMLVSEHALGLAAHHEDFLPRMIEALEPDVIAPDLQDLYKQLIIHYTEDHSSGIRHFGLGLSEKELREWSALVVRGEELYGTASTVELEAEFLRLIGRIQREYYGRALQELTELIREAEADGRAEEVQRLLGEHQSLTQKRRNLLKPTHT